MSNVAPLAFCAFIIFCVSSIRVGINLNAIDIITAISCTGILTYFSGVIRLSSPSVSSVGVVVRVRNVVPITKKVSLKAIIMA